MSTRWSEITQKHDEGMSSGALLFLCERKELEDLQKLKRCPIRATLLLERSIKERAEWLIQEACRGYAFGGGNKGWNL